MAMNINVKYDIVKNYVSAHLDEALAFGLKDENINSEAKRLLNIVSSENFLADPLYRTFLTKRIVDDMFNEKPQYSLYNSHDLIELLQEQATPWFLSQKIIFNAKFAYLEMKESINSEELSR